MTSEKMVKITNNSVYEVRVGEKFLQPTQSVTLAESEYMQARAACRSLVVAMNTKQVVAEYVTPAKSTKKTK